jgi:hypothetical protein
LFLRMRDRWLRLANNPEMLDPKSASPRPERGWKRTDSEAA